MCRFTMVLEGPRRSTYRASFLSLLATHNGAGNISDASSEVRLNVERAVNSRAHAKVDQGASAVLVAPRSTINLAVLAPRLPASVGLLS
jgi:hypothetical protein